MVNFLISNYYKSFDEINLGNSKYLYTKGYYLLWSYDKLPNFFSIGSSSWQLEEDKRKMFFRYMLKIDNPYSVSSKEYNEENKQRKVVFLKMLQIEVKLYSFFVFYFFNLLKLHHKFFINIDNFLIFNFENYTSFLFSFKEAKDFFLRQPSFVLKKFDVLKNYINWEVKPTKFLELKNFNYFSIFFYLTHFTNELFFYDYLLPPKTEEIFLFSNNFFFFRVFNSFLFFFEKGFNNILLGFRDFVSFVKIRFFFFDLANFFYRIVSTNFVMNKFFQIYLNNKVFDEQSRYMLIVNKNIDPEGLKYLKQYIIWEYLYSDIEADAFSDWLNFKDQLELSEVFKYLEQKFKKEFVANELENINFLDNLFFYFFTSRFLYKDIKNFVNKFFISFDKSNIFFYLNFYYLLNNSFFVLDKILFFINTENFKKFYNYELINELEKILPFNPSLVRTFFLEKISSIKEQGNLRLFDSYLEFLKKYLFCFYFLKTQRYASDFFVTMNEKQILYDSFKNFGVLNDNIWFYLVSDFDFNFFIENFLQDYLKIFEFDVYDKTKYFSKRSSSGFFKYSVDFSLRFKKAQGLEFSNEISFYNGNSLFFHMIFILSNVVKGLNGEGISKKK
jgi:hypothetical protein